MNFNHKAQIESLELHNVTDVGLLWLDPEMINAYVQQRSPNQQLDRAVLSCCYTAISMLLGPEPIFPIVFSEALQEWKDHQKPHTFVVGCILATMLRRWKPVDIDFQGELNGENCMIYFRDQEIEMQVPHPADVRPVIQEVARFLSIHEKTVKRLVQ